MKRLILLILLILFAAACGDDAATNNLANVSTDAGTDAAAEPVELTATADATYDWEKRTVVYAQALAHETWNSEESTTIDLEATIWEPSETPEVRPALLIIHGGAFLTGDREQAELVAFAEYFASRGYVVMSASYRVAQQQPTMPEEWRVAITESPNYTSLEKTLGQTMYGATRDARAALRYLQANADELGIAPDRIAAMGGSAGSFIALGIGATEPEAFRDELIGVDPTLDTTNLEQTGQLVAVLDFWGGPEVLEAHELTYGASAWDESDAPAMIVHGTADPTVEFTSAEELRDIYRSTGVPYEFYPIEGARHGPWEAMVEGKTLEQLGFEFATKHQNVTVE